MGLEVQSIQRPRSRGLGWVTTETSDTSILNHSFPFLPVPGQSSTEEVLLTCPRVLWQSHRKVFLIGKIIALWVYVTCCSWKTRDFLTMIESALQSELIKFHFVEKIVFSPLVNPLNILRATHWFSLAFLLCHLTAVLRKMVIWAFRRRQFPLIKYKSLG